MQNPAYIYISKFPQMSGSIHKMQHISMGGGIML